MKKRIVATHIEQDGYWTEYEDGSLIFHLWTKAEDFLKLDPNNELGLEDKPGFQV